MDFWVDIESAAGQKQGAGPITSAEGWRYTSRMDRVGRFRFRLPATDSKASIIQRKRIARAYTQVDGERVPVGAGIIDQIERRVQRDGTVWLHVEGDNLLRELTYRSVLDLKLYAGGNPVSHAAAVAAVAGFAPPGWTFTPDPSPPHDLVYAYFGGNTIASALIKISDKSYTHFYGGLDRTVTFASTFASSGVRAIQARGELQPETCAITQLSEAIDTSDLITRIYPRGSGNADVQLTLRATTRTAPAGYTLNAAQNYIENNAANAVYGRIERQVDFREIGPIENTNADVLAASNALFDAALEELRRRSVELEQATYTLQVAECSQLLRPMQTIRVVYRDLEAGLDINRDLNILESTWEIDRGGLRTTDLVVSNFDRWPASDARLLVDDLEQGQAYQALPQLNANSYVTSYNKPVDQTETASFRFRFGREVTQLQQVLFEFQLLPLESTVKSIGIESETGGSELTTDPAVGNTGSPSNNTSGTPSTNTSGTPSVTDTGAPSVNTSGAPSVANTSAPSVNTSGAPSVTDTGTPSTNTSGSPSTNTSGAPSVTDTGGPSTNTSGAVFGNTGSASGSTGGPSTNTSGAPSVANTSEPSSFSTSTPSNNTSSAAIGSTGTPSTNTSGAPSNNNSGAPSNNVSGDSGLLTTGIPEGGEIEPDGRHVHTTVINDFNVTTSGWFPVHFNVSTQILAFDDFGNTGQKQIITQPNATHTHGITAHTHSLASHSHTLGNHTHNLGSHTHDLGNHTHSLNSHTHTLNEHTHAMSHTHSMAAHTHDMAGHQHSLNEHTHTLGGHSHDLALHTHTLGGHTHTLGNHSHDLGSHTHTLANHTHSLGSHTHTLANHTHTLGGHTHSLGNHTHDLGNHTHNLGNHVHTFTPVITSLYGIHREEIANTFVLSDLRYRVNGGTWFGLETATAVSGNWHRLDITTLVQDSITLRPLQDDNLLEIQRKPAGALLKTGQIDVQLSVRNVIQAIFLN